MKKLILCLAAAVVSLTAAADEGMWLLPYLQKMNIGDMKAKGCQLTAEDIYSVNHGSLKDAIVISVTVVRARSYRPKDSFSPTTIAVTVRFRPSLRWSTTT